MSFTDEHLALIRRCFPLYEQGKTAAQIVAERKARSAKEKAKMEARMKPEREDPLYRSGLSAGRLAKEESEVRRWVESYWEWYNAGNRPRGVCVDEAVVHRRKLAAERVRRHRAKKKSAEGAVCERM